MSSQYGREKGGGGGGKRHLDDEARADPLPAQRVVDRQHRDVPAVVVAMPLELGHSDGDAPAVFHRHVRVLRPVIHKVSCGRNPLQGEAMRRARVACRRVGAWQVRRARYVKIEYGSERSLSISATISTI